MLDELNAIYEGAPVALAVIDGQGRYLRANRVWCDAFVMGQGVSPGQALGESGAPSALRDAARQALEADKPFATEIEVVDTGSSRAWQAVFAPLRDDSGLVSGVSAVATDVTDIRRAERELRAADKRKDEFVSMLAHELRNPLAPIVNAIEVLDRTPSDDQAARMRSLIRRQAKVMARLVDDLLDVARVNLGKIALRLEPVSIREVCDSAVDATRHSVEVKGQRLEVAIDDWLPEIRADKARLEQVVSNLLGNAVKYGRESGRVSLAARLEAGEIVVVVEDDGRGISAEFLPHVFDLFAQESPSSHGGAQAGLGIGLALVRKLVELHGGTVRAFSDGPGLGSRFAVHLPVDLPPGSNAERGREAAAGAQIAQAK